MEWRTSQSVHSDMNIQAHPGAKVKHNETYPQIRSLIIHSLITRLLLNSDISDVPQASTTLLLPPPSSLVTQTHDQPLVQTHIS